MKTGTYTGSTITFSNYEIFDMRLLDSREPFVAFCTICFSLLFAVVGPGQVLAQQTGTIEGTVMEAGSGNALPGVNVVVEDTQQGASTDMRGVFTISGIEPGTYTVRASFVGYTDAVREGVEVRSGETTSIDFQLQTQAQALDEVVVVGYGEQQRQDLTGAVSSIDVAEIENTQPRTIDEALQGQVAGVQVTQTSNAPGGGISVRVRGNSSITAGSEPLYVIDGVPIYNDNSELNPTSASSNTPAPNALSFLNPNDIESIEVLKDASAKAIYGSRGANGVVMVETKSGQSGETRVNFESSVGLKTPAKTVDVLNAEEHARMSNRILQITDGQAAFENPASLGEGTDYQDRIYNRALSQQYSLSVGGGNETTTYHISGSYDDENSVINQTDSDRYSVRASVESQPYDFFRYGGNISGSRTENRLGQLEGASRAAESIGTAALQMWPQFETDPATGNCPRMDINNLESADNPLGVFNGGGRNTENPICGLEGTNDEYRLDRSLATLFAEISLFEGFSIETRGSADISNVRRQAYFSRLTRLGDTQGGQAQVGNTERSNFTLEVLPRYSAQFLPDWQSLDITSGFSMEQETVANRGVSNSQFPTDVTGFNAIQAGTQSGGPGAGSNKVQSTMVSAFGRFNYQLFDRYLFTGTVRGDGSSRFGENRRWGIFPSGAVAWRAAEEDFVPEFFNQLKLRVSWGITGNQEIGEFAQFTRLGAGNCCQYNFDGTIVGGVAPTGLGNSNLGWEETTEWNVGLDASILDGRVSASVDWFHQDTEDLLLNVDLPFEAGFQSATQNAGSLTNTGVEITLRTNLAPSENFRWRQQINLTRVINEVTSLGPNDRIFGGQISADSQFGQGQAGPAVIPGEPIGVFWGWETDGIFQTQEEADAYEPQPNALAGQTKFVDHNGDGQITTADKHVVGDPNPDLTFGWSNTFRYGSLSLDVFLQGQLGGDIWNATRQEIGGNSEGSISPGHNTFEERFKDAWSEDNRDAKWPRLAIPSGETGTQFPANSRGPLVDMWVEDGSYLRAESITLTWNIDDQFTIPWTSVRSASVYVGANNLFTITDYSGVDPDVNTEGQNNIRQGIDLGAVPLARSYRVGFRLGL